MRDGKLNRYVVFDAYGSDSPDRTEFTRLGVDKAGRPHGRLLSQDEVTRRRERTSRGRHGDGVASGHYDADQLHDGKADHALESLTAPFSSL
jgi:phosphoglycolate phosphatase